MIFFMLTLLPYIKPTFYVSCILYKISFRARERILFIIGTFSNRTFRFGFRIMTNHNYWSLAGCSERSNAL